MDDYSIYTKRKSFPGLLQIISILFADTFMGPAVRFMRTKSKAVPSEATVAHFMRKNIYQLFRFFPDLPLTLIISQQQGDVLLHEHRSFSGWWLFQYFPLLTKTFDCQAI